MNQKYPFAVENAMKWKDTPRKRKLKATDEIRRKYQAKPIIALYHDEAETILKETIGESSHVDKFHAWLEEWRKFIFKEANFIIRPRTKFGAVAYAAYRINGRNITISVFSDECDDSCVMVINPDYLDLEELFLGVESVDFHGSPEATVTVSSTIEDIDETNRMLEAIDKSAKTSALEFEFKHNENIRRDPSLKEKFERTAVKYRAKMDGVHSKYRMEATERLFQMGMAKTAITILATLFHFHDRRPKVYEAANEAHTEGYSKHNDLYNPLKRLNPPAIVRPRNGTRSWFEQQRAKHTESWHVKGHSRTLKAERYKEKRGQTIWVNPFVKGSGENMRLSIYVDQIGAGDVVEVEEVRVATH
jgi:hypothetical protein